MAASRPRRAKRVTARKKSKGKRSRARSPKTKGRKSPSRRQSAPRKKRPQKKKRAPSVAKHPLGTEDFDLTAPLDTRGLGLEAGGQAGDTEGLSRAELAASESVEELLEEGQAFEAGVVSGVENAPEADQEEVTTREVPEDDVPEEYLDND